MSTDQPDLERIVKAARKLSRPYRIDRGRGFRLKDCDPADTGALGREDKPRAVEALRHRRRARWPSCRTCSTRRIAGRCC